MAIERDHPGARQSYFWTRALFSQGDLDDVARRVPQLLSSKELRAQLELEMLRSDRTASPVTLLLFSVRAAPDAEALRLGVEQLARVVNQHTRKTDCKGWYRDVRGLHVALLLPHTGPQGADPVIVMIQEHFRMAVARLKKPPPGGMDIACEIYAYPSDREKEDGQFRQLYLFEDAALAPKVRLNGHGQPPEEAPEDAGEVPEDAGEVPEDAGEVPEGVGELRTMSGMPIHSAEQLLVCPPRLWKRLLDITISLTVLMLCSPLLLITAVLIKLTSRGAVLFKQERVGYLGRPFRCWKFRSMTMNVDVTAHREYLASLIEQGDGHERPMIKLDNGDHHITTLGRILRVTCIDELPQLVNVLRGEMSLVGPRPCLPYELEKYQHWHYRRLDTVPGITGLWQVMGKNRTTFRQMIRLDIIYARRCSFWFDIKILFMTIPAILREINEWLSSKEIKEVNDVQRA